MDLTKINELDTKPDSLSVSSKIVSIAEPIESPKTPSEEMVKTPEDKSKNQLTPTITEENELDEPINNNSKSSLSLPVEAPTSGPVGRKLSVQGLMAFAERRRSSSTFSDMRKMSVSNGDGIHVKSPGGIGKPFCLKSERFFIATHFQKSKSKTSHSWRTSISITTIIKDDQIRGMLGSG